MQDYAVRVDFDLSCFVAVKAKDPLEAERFVVEKCEGDPSFVGKLFSESQIVLWDSRPGEVIPESIAATKWWDHDMRS